jgi:hypothetical protein
VSREFLFFLPSDDISAQRSLRLHSFSKQYTLYNRPPGRLANSPQPPTSRQLDRNTITQIVIDVDQHSSHLIKRQSSHQSQPRHCYRPRTTKIVNQQHQSHAMDHLCPRLSFPLAPCMSCLSGGSPVSTPTTPKASRRSNFIQSMVFPMPPRSPRTSSRSSSRMKQNDKRSRRPKLSLQTRLSTIPQSQVMEELQASLAAFVIGQSSSGRQAPSHAQPISVRAMRKDSATAPWLQPIEQVRNT